MAEFYVSILYGHSELSASGKHPYLSCAIDTSSTTQSDTFSQSNTFFQSIAFPLSQLAISENARSMNNETISGFQNTSTSTF